MADLIRLNAERRESYCHVFGRGTGFCAEFIYLLKAYASCRAKGLGLRLQRLSAPKGFAVERGWRDYFEPFFPEIDLGSRGFLNRPRFRMDRWLPVRAVAEGVLRWRSGCRYFLFSDLSRLPDRGEAPSWGAMTADQYWGYMEQLARSLWRYNDSTRRQIDGLRSQVPLEGSYAAVHVRRGDKSSEFPYASLECYENAIRQLGERGGRRLFVATDHMEVVRELAARLGSSYEVNHNPCMTARGHDQGRFNSLAAADRREATIQLFFDLEMIFGAEVFVGTATSNVYFAARYLRGNRAIVAVDGPDRAE